MRNSVCTVPIYWVVRHYTGDSPWMGSVVTETVKFEIHKDSGVIVSTGMDRENFIQVYNECSTYRRCTAKELADMCITHMSKEDFKKLKEQIERM